MEKKYFVLNELPSTLTPNHESLMIGIIEASDNKDFNSNIQKICREYFGTNDIDFGTFRIETFERKNHYGTFTIIMSGAEIDVSIQTAPIFFGEKTTLDLFAHMESWLGKDQKINTNSAQVFAMLVDLMVKIGIHVNEESSIKVKIV